MIVLRNLMLAIAAFFVAGTGFYSYLLKTLPPDQILSQMTETPHPPSPNTDPGVVDVGGGVAGQADRAAQVAALSSAIGTATSTSTQPADQQDASTSRWALAAAIMGDFLAARRETTAPDATPAVKSVPVPDWLEQRFDQAAAGQGKTLGVMDKSSLLVTLLELRALKQQQMAAQKAVPPDAQGSTPLPDLGLTARAMQAELQFRQTLGVGLAEFVKSLSPEDLARLLAMPAPASVSPSPVVQVSAGR